MAHFIEQMTFSQIDPLEEELLFSLNPVRPNPEFVNRLGQRLKREPAMFLENRNWLGAYLVVASGLFGGALMVFSGQVPNLKAWLAVGDSQFGSEFFSGRFHQHTSIREKNGWDASEAMIYLFHIAAGIRILVDIDPAVFDPILVQKAPGAPGIPTPGSSINNDFSLFSHDPHLP
jgi:hypothetical protein